MIALAAECDTQAAMPELLTVIVHNLLQPGSSVMRRAKLCKAL